MKLLTTTVLILLISVIHGQTLTNVQQLYTDVFANLNTNVIPNSDQSRPLTVALKFYLISISQLIETAQTIDILGGVQMMWTDGGISWNPASYGNKQMIPLGKNNIWTPSLTLVNAIDTLDPIGKDTNFNANIFSNGTVLLAIGDILSAKCTINVSKFPFDSQTCVLQFTVWNMMASELIFSADPSIDLTFYSSNADWKLLSYSSKAFVSSPYNMYIVTLTIKREPLYYGVIILLPTLLFGFLNPLVFVLPVESGERIGLAMTILLSYAIFLTLVTASVPATSNPMCVLLIVMMLTIVLSGIVVVMAILISQIYCRDETTNMNAFWKFIGTRLPWSKKRLTKVKPIWAEKYDKGTDSSMENSESSPSWKEVADALDILCIIIFWASCIIGSIVLFAYLAS